jgi:hypothetical protein
MAALSRVFPGSDGVSFISPLGPFKVQVFVVTAGNPVDNPDTTLSTTLQNPQSVSVISSSTDLAGTADAASATISGKAISLHDMTASRQYLVLVVGQ